MLSQTQDLERVFRKDAIAPETAAFNEKLGAEEAASPHFDEVGPVGARQRRREQWQALGGKTSAMAEERTIPGPGGPIPIRVLRPDVVKGVYLHFHGGGMVLGDALYSDMSNESIAQNCELAVVSVNYHLAPEHVYPAGPDDAEAAALWLAKNARAEFGTDALAIGGESAGGYLAAAILLRLRDRHQLNPFKAANLVFGVYDFSGTPSQLINGQTTIALDLRRMRWFASNYVEDPQRLRDPDISPLWGDLHDLPPALFTVGTADPLLDDSMFMHARWLAAGNHSEIAIYPGATHLFTAQPTPVGREACARIETFLKSTVPSAG